MLQTLQSPIALSDSYKAALIACYAPGFHFVLSDDGSSVTAWNDTGGKTPMPNEAAAIAMQQQGFVNMLTSHGAGLKQTATDKGTWSQGFADAVDAEVANTAMRVVAWPNVP